MGSRRVLVLAAAAVLLGGCGGRTIDADKAEQALAGQRTSQGTVKSVDCPRGVKPKGGTTYDCKVTMENGARGTWSIEVVGDQGLVRVSPDQLDVPSARGAGEGKKIGTAFALRGPHGSKLRATLVRYEPSVAEPSGDRLEPRVAGIVLRIENVGSRPLRAKRPTYYSIARTESGAGLDPVSKATGPCGGAFYRSKLSIDPGETAEGCIPYKYAAAAPPVDWGFGFGATTKRWALK
jgi:Domain of unknown function (DUF4333)